MLEIVADWGWALALSGEPKSESGEETAMRQAFEGSSHGSRIGTYEGM